MLQTWHIGVDDTDSKKGMCTTYLATLFIDFLLKYPIKFLDFPKLIRLNPNIPYKTRGNGAVALTFRSSDEFEDEIWKGLSDLLKNYSDVNDPQTDPGVVLLKGEIPLSVKKLYHQCLYKVIPLNRVKKLLREHPSEKNFFIKSGRGLIGAAAAIGASLSNDYTFEFIAYRDPNLKKNERLIDVQSVIAAEKNNPLSFNNYDYENNQMMIAPHGPDPVFCGIRGETSTEVIKMWESIKILEPVQTTMVFRSNQHTQVHFRKEFLGHEIEPYLSVIVRGVVKTKPKDYPGGHVIFKINSGNVSVDCAAYEPTKRFRKVVRELIEGDEIVVFGGVRPASKATPLTINLEEFQVIQLKNVSKRIIPKCPLCGASLTSAGKIQGFKCKKCSYISSKKDYIEIPLSRKIRAGVRYVIPICAQRHLTKPVSRDLNLQFHIPTSYNFQEAFYDFLKKREQLNNHSLN
ncbi:MAG: DUF1743 domain-containing protein [Candidatus Hodarchaeota archaeon]